MSAQWVGCPGWPSRAAHAGLADWQHQRGQRARCIQQGGGRAASGGRLRLCAWCRANAQQPKLFVGMILILIFAEALALYGLIGEPSLPEEGSTLCSPGPCMRGRPCLGTALVRALTSLAGCSRHHPGVQGRLGRPSGLSPAASCVGGAAEQLRGPGRRLGLGRAGGRSAGLTRAGQAERRLERGARAAVRSASDVQAAMLYS